MKLMATVLTVCLLGLNTVSTHAQAISQNSGEAIQVKKNVLITDMTGARFGEQNIDDVKLWEDGVEQKITSISVNSSPLDLVMVIDDSGSMMAQRNNVVAVSKFIVQNLEPNSRVQVVRFGTEGLRITTDWTSDRSLLLQFLDEAPRAGGGSPIYDGVWTALDQIKGIKTLGEEKRFAVVLISDCMEGGSSHKLNELLLELKKTDAPLFTVLLVEQYDCFVNSAFNSRVEQQLERVPHDMALASGGSAYFPLKGDNRKLPLAETLKDLTAELWSQLVLTYTPTNQNRDGKERKLRFSVADSFDNAKRVMRMKKTYVVADSVQVR